MRCVTVWYDTMLASIFVFQIFLTYFCFSLIDCNSIKLKTLTQTQTVVFTHILRVWPAVKVTCSRFVVDSPHRPNYYRLQGKVMFPQVSVCPQSASWIQVHCSALLQRGRYASYWNAFLLHILRKMCLKIITHDETFLIAIVGCK